MALMGAVFLAARLGHAEPPSAAEIPGQSGFTLESLRHLGYLERIRQALAPHFEFKLDATETLVIDVQELHVQSDISWRALPDLKIRLASDTRYPIIPCHTAYCPGPQAETLLGAAVLYSLTPSTYAGIAILRRTVERSPVGLFRLTVGGTW